MILKSIRKHNVCGLLVLALKCTSIGSMKELCNSVINIQNNITMFRRTSSSTNMGLKCISDLHKEWSSRFESNGVPEADLSTRYIIQHVLDIKESYKYELSQNDKVSPEHEKKIETLCECRLGRMPVQYIIKEWDFRELRLLMQPPVFIPRPETEQLVDLVRGAVPTDQAQVFLEVGCGSGAICLSLLKELPNARVVAVDQSKMACNLTTANAKLNNLTDKLQVVHSKLQEDGTFSSPLLLDKVDVLVSNPPYVPAAQMLDLQPEIKLYEDLRALEAGRDGLRVVRSLLLLAQRLLRPGALMFLEVDSSHPPLIKNWLSDHPQLDIELVQTFKDYCDRERFVKLKKL